MIHSAQSERKIAALNGLRVAETVSVVPHIVHMSPWAGPDTRWLAELVDGIVQERLVAIDWLSHRIADLGREPHSGNPPADLAGLHYHSYAYLLTRIQADLHRVADAYARLMPALQDDAVLCQEVGRLAEMLAAELAQLDGAAQRVAQARATPPAAAESA